MNPLNPQGSNLGWLFVQLPIGFEPIAMKTQAGAPIYFGLGV